MRHVLILLLVSLPLLAQQLSLTGPTAARVGTPVTVQMNYTGSVGTDVSGFQFESPQQPWGSDLANKTMTCEPTTNRCILIGQDNADPLVDGEMASVQWTAPSLPATIEVTSVLATTPDGQPVAIGAPAALTINLLGDVNGDGALTAGDVLGGILQVIAGPCETGDQNGDGQCTVHDVQIIVNEVLSGGG